MGLLDELKQQADTLRQKEQVSQEEISQHLLLVHAKLKETLRYWIVLFNSLNVIKPAITRIYYLEGGATRLDNLHQSGYTVNGRHLSIDHKEYIEAVVLRFRCASGEKLTVEKQNEPVVQRMRERLWSNNVKFELKEIRNERNYIERGIFTIACEVPVTVTIVGDLENGRIMIMAKNLEKFGEYTYVYDFDEFGKEVLEELGKLIIAKPNKLRTMGRHQESMRTTTTRLPRGADDMEPTQSTEQMPMNDTSDPTKSFLGNIKSILKR
jgi:hypothetical protein